MKIFKYIIFLFLSVMCTYAQDTTSNFLPKSLGDHINTAQHELNPVLSYDGKTLYFTRVDSVQDKYWHVHKQYIYVSRLQSDNTWGPAKKLPENVNAGEYNAAVGVSSQGDTLYINGVYTKKTNRWHKRGLSYVVRLDSNTWSNPIKVYVRSLPRMNKGLRSNMSISTNGQMMFVSMSKRLNAKNNNLYRCEKHDDFYWKPKKLKKPIRHPKADEAPFLSHDGSTLYFSSNRNHKNDGKGNQIYKTTATDETFLNWTEPVLLSDTINSDLWDSYYITNIKGSWAYFCSHKNSKGGSDIFRIKIFEENPFILVKGQVVAKKDGAEVVPDVAFRVYANDQPIDTLKVDNKGNFQLLLPLGAKYNLRADAKNYISDGEAIIDALAFREYKETTTKLYIKPSDALVTGRLLTTENKPFLSTQEPKLFVNGKELTAEAAQELGIDTFDVDFEKGKYMVKLPLHKKYTFEIKAKEANAVPSAVDLTNVNEYKEISKDLFAAPVAKVEVKVAVFTGKVINKKTNKPLIGKDFTVQIDEIDVYSAKIDTSKGTYEFELPLGKSHVINAKSHNFYPEYEIVDLTKEKTKVKIMKDLFLSPIEKGQSIKLKNIFFDVAKATLKKESFPELDKLYKFLNDNPEIKVEIAGHTDNKGAADKNMQLSRWRARSVQQYLVQKGIDIKRVNFNGYGLTKPVADNKKEAGRALNRRVEFTILDN